MEVIWTESTIKLGCKKDFIQWGLEQDSSHLMLRFFDKFVFHSEFWGTVLDENSHALKMHTPLFIKKVKLSRAVELKLLIALTEKFGPKKYDFKYFWFLVESALRLKILRKPIPKSVPVRKHNKDTLICHEVLQEAIRLLDEWGIDHGIPKIDFTKTSTPSYVKEAFLKGEEG